MIIHAGDAETAAVLHAAQAMCAAARTAPKTKGEDLIETCILTGDEQEKLAVEMERLSKTLGYHFFLRDAGNIRNSAAVILIGVKNKLRGMNEGCRFCGFDNCADCADHNGICAYGPIDLGIAVGSAVSIAADWRMDNRVMFSAGRAALEMELFDSSVREALAIPISVSGKSPYFDRK